MSRAQNREDFAQGMSTLNFNNHLLAARIRACEPLARIPLKLQYWPAYLHWFHISGWMSFGGLWCSNLKKGFVFIKKWLFAYAIKPDVCYVRGRFGRETDPNTLSQYNGGNHKLRYLLFLFAVWTTESQVGLGHCSTQEADIMFQQEKANMISMLQKTIRNMFENLPGQHNH